MIKNIFRNIKELPHDLYSYLFKRSIYTFFLSISLLCLAICSGTLLFIIVGILFFILLLGTVIHQYFTCVSERLLYVTGECVDKSEYNVMQKSIRRNYIYVGNDNLVYKCYVSSSVHKNTRIGYSVTIYAVKGNIYQDASGEIIINSPMLVISTLAK